MRTKLLIVLLGIIIVSIVLVISIVSMTNHEDTFIPETPQRNLPKDAKARIGKGRIIDVAYVPERNQFAVACSSGIWFYDANSLEEQGFIPENTGNVFSMSISSDGKVLAAVNGGKTIHLWDTETLKHKTTFIRDAYYRPTFVFDYVSFLGDGSTLASRYLGGIDLWDTVTNTHHAELHQRSNLGNIVFSPDGILMANSSSNRIIHLYDVVADQTKQRIKGHKETINSLAFSPDSKTLASGSRDKTVMLWDIETGELKKTLKGHKKEVVYLAFSPDGKTLASGSNDHTVRLWDVATGKRKRTLKKHKIQLRKVIFSPDGKFLLS